MRDFFVGNTVGIPFKIFGLVHLFYTLILTIGMLVIYFKRKDIYRLNKKKKNKIKLILISILFINMAVYYISKSIYGVYNWHSDLPFHLCFISGFLFMYAQLTNNIKLCKMTFFLSFMGPLPAVIWPDLTSSFNHFVFYQYFISHHFFILTSLFMYYANEYTIKKEDAIHVYVFTTILFIFMSIFNNVFGTNYIMSNSLPSQVVKLYPFVTKIHYPIVWLELTGICIILLVYILFHNKRRISYQ